MRIHRLARFSRSRYVRPWEYLAKGELERGRKPITVGLAYALARALDAPLLALLSPMGDEVIELGDSKLTADEFELWAQGMGHLEGMDVDSYVEAGKGLTIPRRSRESAREGALAIRRKRLAKEIEKIDKQMGKS